MGVRFWRIHLDRPERPAHWRCLSDAERRRAEGFADPVERHRYVVAHAALRSVLGRRCGVPGARLTFRAGTAGRPSLHFADGRTPVDFNLSHSGEWALIGVASPGMRVGVDIEYVDAAIDHLELARHFFHAREVDRVEAGGILEYFRLWTAKEAYIKATGAGLAGLRDVRVHQGVLRTSDEPGPPVRWLNVAPGYAAAAVLVDETGRFSADCPA